MALSLLEVLASVYTLYYGLYLPHLINIIHSFYIVVPESNITNYSEEIYKYAH